MDRTGTWTVITGPPASGKSTVAGLLATNAAEPTVHLYTDSFYAWIKTGLIEPHLPQSAEQNEVVVEAIAAAAAAYARGGYDVVLDGIIGPWFVDRYRERASESSIEISYVVLAAPLEVTLRRAVERQGAAHLRDPEPITTMHAQFAELGRWSANVVLTDDRTPEEIAAMLRERLPEGAFRA
ncbi:MAG TPA: AAA family ATPase [Solirubrobacterales bacterium]|jgi:predicted kinase